ncbi:MAG TPA: diguanylate cyclase [Acidobacteriaceae bacterium]|nr:diguanylate cyclase [Acidobacteriaceae bacterium]
MRIAGVIALTAALAWLGLYSGRGAGRVPAVWWANAALVSVLLLQSAEPERQSGGPSEPGLPKSEPFLWNLLAGGRRRHWPILLVAGYAGNVIAHWLMHDPPSQMLLLSACDILETSIAAYGVGFALGDRVDLTEQKQLLQFVAFAVILGPLVASLAAGVILRWLVGSSMAVSLRWFPPSALGMSVIPPLVLGLARRETWELFRPSRLAKTLLYLFLIAAATVIIFSRSDFAMLFLIIPPLLFLVVRLGLSGGALGCCVVAALGTDFTIGRHSALLTQLDPSLEHRIFMLQLFLATAVLSVSVVAVVLADLQRASRDVRESEMRYRTLAASMEMLAALDPLTQVANRRCFDEALDREWQRALRARTPLSLVLFDADYFKAYNDRYGHLAGDDCLRKIADTFTSTVRRPADLVARFGGEEFGIILPDTDAAGAFRLAESLRNRVERLGWSHAASPSGIVTLSGGCASMTPLVGETATDLLNSADEALYEAKRQGRNRIESAIFRRPVSMDL